MFKLTHVCAVPLFAIFALTVPAGCAMGVEGSNESATESAAEQPEAIDDTSESVLAAGGKWRSYDSERCEELCAGSAFGCGCVNLPRCPTKTPQGRACPTIGAQCINQVGAMGHFYRCQK